MRSEIILLREAGRDFAGTRRRNLAYAIYKASGGYRPCGAQTFGDLPANERGQVPESSLIRRAVYRVDRKRDRQLDARASRRWSCA